MPAPAADDSSPTIDLSTKVTSYPFSLSLIAVIQPTTHPPIMTAFTATNYSPLIVYFSNKFKFS